MTHRPFSCEIRHEDSSCNIHILFSVVCHIYGGLVYKQTRHDGCNSYNLLRFVMIFSSLVQHVQGVEQLTRVET